MKEEQKVEQKEEPKVEQKAETNPTTLMGFFIAEYYDLKKENKKLKKKVEYWKACSDRAERRYEVCNVALKAVKPTMTERGYISLDRVYFEKDNEGFKALKRFIEENKANND